ncbi:hypothetical protein [Legionella bononiensis]|uniref:Uncharacterized protein n=1 Tax=Legionella bononiensis TaxID=2793102 RepID=A0ABS1WD29_9GAMM|nr:hypothetical protein [Legionella bononiensis]MBL7479130.1 hypothetical protein [Legionella bononiensis]MBL7527263.1 hypothetical protein [Legionella bononiensis]MBL7562232.1 hypothetical protein [Legionella bononiensis]
MATLNTILQTCSDNDEKLEFMFKFFERIKIKVDEVLTFGAYNSAAAIRTRNKYVKQMELAGRDRFFKAHFDVVDLHAIPAILAGNKIFEIEPKSMTNSPEQNYEEFLKIGYLYGTGTCEIFAIMGAYFMALEFDLELSIETLYSDSSHTYIRVHTNPEYIIDFWGPMLCVYEDTVSWNEFFGQALMRDGKATVKTEVKFNSERLIELGHRIFTQDNSEQRFIIHNEINEQVHYASSSMSNC